MANTFTASEVTALQALHGGLTTVHSNWVMGTDGSGKTSTTASDIIWLAKIPNGAILVDGYLSGRAVGGASILKVGMADLAGGGFTISDAALISATTFSSTSILARFGGAGRLPAKVSFSVTDNPQYRWIFATVNSVGASTSCSLNFMVSYLMGERK